MHFSSFIDERSISESLFLWSFGSQRVGIAKAKRDGKFKGRVPTAKNKSAEIIELTNQGMKPSEIAKKLDIGVATVYRHRLEV